MESSASDDDGDPATSSYYRVIFFFSFFLLASTKPGHDRRETALLLGDRLKCSEQITPPPVIVKKSGKKKKKIYLTFDDGPNKGTQNVLDIVQQEQVPATFFIVGEHVFASLEQARTWDSLQSAENIEICNHSYSHAHHRYENFYQHPDTVVKDMELTKEKFLPGNNIVRAPGRNSWRIDSIHYTDIKKSRAAMDSLEAAGFVVMGWDLEWHYDAKTMIVKNTADELLNQVDSVLNNNKTKTTDHLILLAHDQVYKKSGDSMELRQFVQKIKLKEDYELSLVSSYPGVIKRLDTLRVK